MQVDFGQSTWGAAFEHARAVASASDATVKDFLERQSHGGGDGAEDEEGGSKKRVETGAFNHPKVLADFVSRYILGLESAAPAYS